MGSLPPQRACSQTGAMAVSQAVQVRHGQRVVVFQATGFEQNSIVDHHLVVVTLLPPWGLPEETSGPAVYLNAAVVLMAHLFGITSQKLDLFMLCGPFKL